jgi:hypothetical protein
MKTPFLHESRSGALFAPRTISMPCRSMIINGLRNLEKNSYCSVFGTPHMVKYKYRQEREGGYAFSEKIKAKIVREGLCLKISNSS